MATKFSLPIYPFRLNINYFKRKYQVVTLFKVEVQVGKYSVDLDVFSDKKLLEDYELGLI